MNNPKLVAPLSHVLTLDMYEPEAQEYLLDVMTAFLTSDQLHEYIRLLNATDDIEDQEEFERADREYIAFIRRHWPRK